MKQLLGAGLEVSIVLLPAGKDPDELLHQEGREAFHTLLQQAVPFPEFYVHALLEEHEGRSLRGQEEILAAARTFLADLESPALRAQILREVSGSLDIPLEDLRLGVKGSESSVIMGSSAPDKQSWGVEEHLMYLMLQGEYPIERAIREVAPQDFQKFSRAVEILFTLYREEAHPPDRLGGAGGQQFLNEWLSRLDPEDQQALRELAVSERRDADSETAVAQLLMGQLRLASVERRFAAVEREIKDSQKRRDNATILPLQEKQQELSRERRQLHRQLGWEANVVKGGGRRHGG